MQQIHERNKIISVVNSFKDKMKEFQFKEKYRDRNKEEYEVDEYRFELNNNIYIIITRHEYKDDDRIMFKFFKNKIDKPILVNISYEHEDGRIKSNAGMVASDQNNNYHLLRRTTGIHSKSGEGAGKQIKSDEIEDSFGEDKICKVKQSKFIKVLKLNSHNSDEIKKSVAEFVDNIYSLEP